MPDRPVLIEPLEALEYSVAVMETWLVWYYGCVPRPHNLDMASPTSITAGVLDDARRLLAFARYPALDLEVPTHDHDSIMHAHGGARHIHRLDNREKSGKVSG